MTVTLDVELTEAWTRSLKSYLISDGPRLICSASRVVKDWGCALKSKMSERGQARIYLYCDNMIMIDDDGNEEGEEEEEGENKMKKVTEKDHRFRVGEV